MTESEQRVDGPARQSPDGRIVVDDLTKVFGSQRAVDRLSFTVEPGSVTGFLGPNGAGKTTTLRMLLGLVKPTSGRATVNGVRYESLPRPLQTVGAALEASSFHPAHTGRQHLVQHGDERDDAGVVARLDRLVRVGVTGRDGRRALGVPTTVRDTRGSDIDGACGQLAAATA